MSRRDRRPGDEWAASPQGRAKYESARAAAQRDANADGYDRGIERNDHARDYTVRMLPQRRHRFGHEAACEAIDRCRHGHGPMAKAQ